MNFLLYDIRVAVLVAVFYMFYRLLLSRDSLHQLNRAVLLSTAAASFVLPPCVITVHHTELLPASYAVPAPTLVPVGSVAVAAAPWWQTALPAVFWAGVAATLLYTVLSIARVCALISRCDKHREADGVVIAVSEADVSPFSWMHYIVMSRADYACPDKAILVHEREHIRRHHSWDVLLVDVLSSLQWFNPAMWMLRSDLRAVHEYEADEAVLLSGVDARQYQYLLVRKAMAAAGFSVANGINHSTLKQRITMMNTRGHGNGHARLKALYVIPIVAASLFASARTVTDYEVMPPTTLGSNAKGSSGHARHNPATTSTARPAGDGEGLQDATLVAVRNRKDPNGSRQAQNRTSTQEDGDSWQGASAAAHHAAIGAGKIWEAVERMPEYDGGKKAMMNFFATNTKYPAEAQRNGVQGRVVVRFVVNEDGSVSDPKTVANLSRYANASIDVIAPNYPSPKGGTVTAEDEERGRAALAREAERLVSMMPKWKPGEQNGKAVKVYYSIPIRFKIM